MKKVNWLKLMQQIPNRVQVSSNIYYEILWIDAFREHDTMGETRHDMKQIVLLRNLSPKETVKTYMHEIAHVFSDYYKFSMTERQVLFFEKCLTYTLKNGNIFKSERRYDKKRIKRKVSKNSKKARKNTKRS